MFLTFETKPDGPYLVWKLKLFDKILVINPFLANIPTLYTQKTENQTLSSGVFRGYKMEILARNGKRK